MGIYFDYDYEDGKEVENWVPCFLCGEKKVLYVEYHIKKGPIYTLLNDSARKLWSGHEINIISDRYLVCEDCYSARGSEEKVIEDIIALKRSKSVSTASDLDPLKLIENEIEETKNRINELIEKLEELCARKERIKIEKNL